MNNDYLVQIYRLFSFRMPDPAQVYRTNAPPPPEPKIKPPFGARYPRIFGAGRQVGAAVLGLSLFAVIIGVVIGIVYGLGRACRSLGITFGEISAMNIGVPALFIIFCSPTVVGVAWFFGRELIDHLKRKRQ